MRHRHVPTTWPCPPGFNGRLAGTYRWWSGRPLNGHRYTDSTFLHYGTSATDISGKATRYQLWPGWKRLLYVRVPAMVTPALAGSLAIGHWEAPSGVAVATVATVATKTIRGRARRRHRRQVIEPLAKSVAKILNKRHIDGHGWTWVDVPLDIRDNPLATVAITLPIDWPGDQGDRVRLAKVVMARLATEDMVANWDMASVPPVATFRVPDKPPANLAMADVANLAIAETDLAMGHGPRGHMITFSLTTESPHIMLAAASGAGKSELLAFLVGQLMRRGYGLVVLDAKYVSHMWARRVPGVLYASEDEELHEALLWLDGEMKRRARFVAAGGNPDTLVPLVVLLEEMNGASNRLRAYWQSIKVTGQPMMSPALTALGNLSSMGRELRVHILMAGQSMSAKATAGAENRENFGGRALARATSNQWRMLAPQIKPAPVKRLPPGRWHLVVGDVLREFQAPFMDIKGQPGRLIEWVLGGCPVPDVPAMMHAAATTASASVARSEAVTAEVAGISLRLYAEERGVGIRSLRDWRDRRSDFPVEVGEGANRTKLYDREHLDRFVAARLREPVE